MKPAKAKARRRKNKKNLPPPPPRVKPVQSIQPQKPDYSDESEHDSDEGSSDSDVEDAEDYRKGGYHAVSIGDLFNAKYRVISKLGWGHFSTVWMCKDESQSPVHEFVALKIQKSASKYCEAADDEITILQQIREGDPDDKYCCVQLLGSFRHRGPNGQHVCMVFPVFGANLLGLIKAHDYHGAPLDIVKAATRQVLRALDYCHSKLQMIHTDLKPENVLLIRHDYDKLIEDARARHAYIMQYPTAVSSRRRSSAGSKPAQHGAAAAASTNSSAAAAGAPISKSKKKRMKKKAAEAKKEAAAAAAEAPGTAEAVSESSGEVSTVQSNQESCTEATETAASSETASSEAAGGKAAGGEAEGACSETPAAESECPPAAAPPVEAPAPKLSIKEQRMAAERALMQNAAPSPVPSKNRPRSKEQRVALERQLMGQAANQGASSSGDSGTSKAAREEQARVAANAPPMPDMRKQDLLSLTGEESQCKLADLGSGCWTYKQFTDDIQTRQYRCPEVILGAGYSCPADMWSMACLVFELSTGELMFDPHSGRDYSRDEDHLAQMIELLGKFPKKLAVAGKYSNECFNKKGDLKHIKKLNSWPLYKVLSEKYEFPHQEALQLSQFLEGMLNFNPAKRKTAAECLLDPWLNNGVAQQPAEPCPASSQDGDAESNSLSVSQSLSVSPVAVSEASTADTKLELLEEYHPEADLQAEEGPPPAYVEPHPPAGPPPAAENVEEEV